MASLPCPDLVLVRLDLNPHFQPCESRDGDEIYPNGIFEFNITRLLAYIDAATRFHAELVALDDLPHAADSRGLNELLVLAADLTRPVILAEIAPGRYNLIDGHHRLAKAQREGIPRIPVYRIRCPEHVPFLTTTRAYAAYVDYWNSKVDDALADQPTALRCSGFQARIRYD
jgi:ParB-like nuclease domain